MKQVRCLLLILCLLKISAGALAQGPSDAELKSLQQPALQEVPEPVGLTDWPALSKALKRDETVAGRIASFRELWSAGPGELKDPIAISGVILRRFRREPVGQFPALEELWLRTDDDALVIVTHKSRDKKQETSDITAPGSAVEVSGIFLRNVRYDAKDEPRVAPWVVASRIRPMGTPQPDARTAAVQAKAEDETRKTGLVLLTVVAGSALLRLAIAFAGRSGRRR